MYSEATDRTMLNREERERVANMLKGPKAVADLNLMEVRNAVARAKRSDRDLGNRQRLIGANVGAMCGQLLYWDGKGEADDFWIHKTASDWMTADASLTKRMLKTAERVAMEEGLIQVVVGKRPGDRQNTVWYRLNMWELARVVVASQLENIGFRLEHEGRKNFRDKLNKRRRELERARDDLNLLGERDPSESEAHKGAATSSGQGDNSLYLLQENTHEIPPCRGEAEPALAEPAAQQNREDRESAGGSTTASLGHDDGTGHEIRQDRRFSRRRPRPDAVACAQAEAFKGCREGRYAGQIRRLSYLALEYDFAQEARPHAYVWLSLARSEDDRTRVWKAMQRVARTAVRAPG